MTEDSPGAFAAQQGINEMEWVDEDSLDPSEWALVEKYGHRAPCSTDLSAQPEAAQLALRLAVDQWMASVKAEGCKPVGDHPIAGFEHDPVFDITTVYVHGRVIPVTDGAKLKAAARALDGIGEAP